MTTAKKTSAKKTSAKKTSAKKTSAKKTSAKKTTAKQATRQLVGAESAAGALATVQRVRAQLLAHALGLPAAWEDHPWGESVAKVGKKVFAFFGMSDENHLREGLGMSVKLPRTGDLVLALPFAEPTGYGLGRSGWVSVRIPPAELPPLSVLTAWIEESYRTIAPKTKVAELEARGPVDPSV